MTSPLIDDGSIDDVLEQAGERLRVVLVSLEGGLETPVKSWQDDH